MTDNGKGNNTGSTNGPLGQLSDLIQSRCIDPCENPPKDSDISFWGFLGQLSGIAAYSLFVVQAAFFTYSAWLQYVQFKCKEKEEAESTEQATASEGTPPTRTVTVKEKRAPKGVSGGTQASQGTGSAN